MQEDVEKYFNRWRICGTQLLGNRIRYVPCSQSACTDFSFLVMFLNTSRPCKVYHPRSAVSRTVFENEKVSQSFKAYLFDGRSLSESLLNNCTHSSSTAMLQVLTTVASRRWHLFVRQQGAASVIICGEPPDALCQQMSLGLQQRESTTRRR